MIANESVSQFPIHSAILRDQSAGTNSSSIGAAERISSTKRRRKLFDEAIQKRSVFVGNSSTQSDCNLNSTKQTTSKSSVVTSHVPDVASAIEDLLEQTTKVKSGLSFNSITSFHFYFYFFLQILLFSILFKIQDQKSPGKTGCDKSVSFY
ncbi:hypothetical protein CSA_021614 [Cucumis sativus]|uniref:Uncharacterized protein n=2 Tax=Cucumis sativus TaxID=3659 RepID=A0ACB6HBX3_CUCSA|nr:hypothetical protein CSA_021600 [Cucumis sativus]KAE8637428.1 hypothetical protein CSA_021614 [Cucumis sativus]